MQLSEMTWPMVDALSRDVPVVIPIAAVEQHGHHLPVYTDSYLLGEIVRRVSSVHDQDALFCPLQWLGNSDHHMDFVGTVSARPRTYLDLLRDLGENWLRHGFKRIMFINGHGGNDVPGKQAVFELRQAHRDRSDLLLLMATYWGTGSNGGPGSNALTFVQNEMGHACEWETSMMLALNPALVGDYRDADPVAPGNAFLPASRGWTTRDRSAPGHIGVPQAASAEKGEVLFSKFSSEVGSLLDRVIAWDGQSWEG
ncbi:MAG: creatininase family protein [Verrucomicrobia bacterium]|nr:creatininase family protein [Verrucomicrobiota bacterium]